MKAEYKLKKLGLTDDEILNIAIKPTTKGTKDLQDILANKHLMDTLSGMKLITELKRELTQNDR